MTVRRAAAAVLAALLACVGVPVMAAEGDLAAVQRVLDRRAQAILKGDRGAFLATVDPEASKSFRDAQRRSFDGWRAMPLASYSLEARLEDSGDLASAAAGRHRGIDRSLLPETRQRYRLRDYDDRDSVEHLWLTYVLRDGTWYVASDTDLEDLGLDTMRNLWELGDVRLQRTDHFLLISHSGQTKRAQALAGIAEDAMRVASTAWDQPWSGRVPVIVPGSIEELEVILQSTVDLDKFVAFVSYGAIRDRGGYEPTAPRMYVQDRNLGRYPRRYQVETLVHELTHAAGAPLSGPATPAWVHEGIAEWITKGKAAAAGPKRGTRLPRDYEFVTGSGSAILGSYNESRSAIAALAGAKGEHAPTAFFRELGRSRWEPGNQDHLVDAALRRSAGLGVSDLEVIWAR